MTKPNGDDYTPMLPGLAPPDRAVPDIVHAVRTTFAALDADGLLLPRHAALMQLALDLAEQVGAAKVSRRGTAMALVAAQLREVLESLPVPEVVSDDGWTELEAALSRAAARDTPQ